MGLCISSTTEYVDPITGEVKKTKKNGGSYPGQGGQNHAPYQPPASAFQNGQATAHFVSCGGGNALTLQQSDGSTKPQHGGPTADQGQFIQVTLPAGVESGQKIHVKAPDGRINEIIIPSGYGPGMSFTVEFAPASAGASTASSAMPPNKMSTQQAAAMNNTRPSNNFNTNSNSNGYGGAYAPVATTNNGADDGFATGFNNPSWTPPPPTASATVQEGDIDLSSYPTSHAVAVNSNSNSNYPPPPRYD